MSQLAVAASVDSAKINLLGMSLSKLQALFKEWGEPAFRATQVIKWIHQYGVSNINDMTNVSMALRTKLQEVAEIRPPEVVSHHLSADGTCKWLIRVDGGSCVEAVLIPEKNRGTLCVSSQVGCVLDCSFCSTGKQGFNRDLTAAEIIGQLWIANRFFDGFQKPNSKKALGDSAPSNQGEVAKQKISNVVMMGMGEPLLNFDNVIDAMQLMMEDNAYGLSKRRVTLSTAGVVPAIDRLADFVDVSLAISLHAANDDLRNQLVPLNRKYPIAELLRSANAYIARMPDNRRRLTVEYTLIGKVNDSLNDAEQLAELLVDTPCKINLIPFNPFPGIDYVPVSNNALYRFRDCLQQKGYVVNVRTTRGDDIAAACGQLAGQVNDRTKRSQRYAQAGKAPLKGMIEATEIIV